MPKHDDLIEITLEKIESSNFEPNENFLEFMEIMKSGMNVHILDKLDYLDLTNFAMNLIFKTVNSSLMLELNDI